MPTLTQLGNNFVYFWDISSTGSILRMNALPRLYAQCRPIQVYRALYWLFLPFTPALVPNIFHYLALLMQLPPSTESQIPLKICLFLFTCTTCHKLRSTNAHSL